MGDSDHPTILIVHKHREFRDALSRHLQEKGYLALAAQDAREALGIVIRHSRPIHLLLADDRDDDRVMVARLKPYRPEMNVIHINPSLNVSAVLMEVYKVLDPPVYALDAAESSLDQVEVVLATKVNEARRHFLESERDFLEVTTNVPSGMPTRMESRGSCAQPTTAGKRLPGI